ncbi:prolipoprotein diacylglyceryl transferase [Desulfuromonas acetoxidans]|nr:prolipoprotein diacylglyceryl transferase [Desulfuromonas acetoxidans]MBF0645102.1 prolipoprotein diacylglyceryl transferase [Desulfuromonas acetoxidans]NVD23089.1 prolipoprotein diacylglyceryl transferase [Desulfuromonas acetoxidans]NVE15670.1 prolipoprotein diacylglyceryl transferase [Desulfuromonas acetoxidans]
MTYPDIDPVAIEIGPLAIRWYGLMYLAGFICAYAMIRRLTMPHKRLSLSSDTVADLLFACVLGVVLGGRLGYVLFYNASFYLEHPTKILSLWEGGMSFHGGLLGVIVAALWFCRKRQLPVASVADILVISSCFGLFFGRLGNFINGELWGRVSSVPWAMVFPGAGPLTRHPSQLYEAVLEGPVLLLILLVVYRANKAAGSVFFAFVSGYAGFRFVVEFFRQPDAHLGAVFAGMSMGQLLSLPMMLIGLAGIVWLNMRRPCER